MDWDLIWKTIIVVIGGTFLLRMAGRKSISQMTLAQTVIMIGIGSLLIQPIADESMSVTLLVAFILVLTLIIIEFLQVKSDPLEKLITGKSKIVIANGTIQEENLKKMRMTVDQLEMNLRLQNIAKIEDVEWAALETNGQVSCLLKEEAQPVTKREFNQLIQLISQGNGNQQQQLPPDQLENIFAEINRGYHKSDPPKHLQ